MKQEVTEAASVARIVEEIPKTFTVDRQGVLLVPDGMKAQPMKTFADALRERPERRKGTAVFSDEASFTEHAKRFASEHSAIFADVTGRTLTAVLNYHDKGHDGEANHGDHRSAIQLLLSPELLRWSRTGEMDQEAFAALIDERGGDLVSAVAAETTANVMEERFAVRCGSPKEIRETARAFGIHAEEQVDAKVKADGSIAVSFSVENKAPDGRPLDVPGLFLIAIPIFDRAPRADLLAVRLRFSRKREGSTVKVVWRLEIVDLNNELRAAFGAACERIATGTGLPLFMGTPEI